MEVRLLEVRSRRLTGSRRRLGPGEQTSCKTEKAIVERGETASECSSWYAATQQQRTKKRGNERHVECWRDAAGEGGQARRAIGWCGQELAATRQEMEAEQCVGEFASRSVGADGVCGMSRLRRAAQGGCRISMIPALSQGMKTAV